MFWKLFQTCFQDVLWIPGNPEILVILCTHHRISRRNSKQPWKRLRRTEIMGHWTWPPISWWSTTWALSNRNQLVDDIWVYNAYVHYTYIYIYVYTVEDSCNPRTGVSMNQEYRMIEALEHRVVAMVMLCWNLIQRYPTLLWFTRILTHFFFGAKAI